jgi:hypothetical protein
MLGPYAVKPDGSLDLSYYGVDTGLYHTHLERWYRHFNRDQVIISSSQTSHSARSKHARIED